MKNKKIYIASPLGFSEAGRFFMNQKVMPVIEQLGFEIIDPWNLTPKELIKPVMDKPFGKEKREQLKDLNNVIGKNNTDALKKADGVFAVLDGTDVDSGTASEIGFACALGIPILGYRGDFRLSADNEGSVVNLQVEYFIKLSGGSIIKNIGGLGSTLEEIFA